MEEKRKRFLAIAAIITVVNGICFTLFPSALVPLYAIEPTLGVAVGFRFFGVALLTFGLILWFVRTSHDWNALRGLLLGASIGNVVGVLVALWAVLSGGMNAMGWVWVLTYGLLLLGYLYYLRAGSDKATSG